MRVILGGQELTGRIEGTENLTVAYTRKGEGGSPSIAFSSELVFYDDGYDLIKSKLVDASNGSLNSLSIEIFDDCCSNAIFVGVVTGTNIEWCEDDCFITVQAVEDSEIAKQLNCIRSTLIGDNENGFQQLNHPSFLYCNELRPQFLHDIIIIFGILYVIVYGIIAIITGIILGIVDFLGDVFANLLGLEEPNWDQPVKDMWFAILTMKAMTSGCRRNHPSPLVRSYIQNVCDICGLKFKSSILNDANSRYHNLCYLNAPIKKGRIDQQYISRKDITKTTDENATGLIVENIPLITLTELLEQMKVVFNADYIINDGSLIFERKDFFESSNVWKESNTMNITDGICYTWIGDEKPPASAKFEYSEDAIDTVGNEALARYNEIVSWRANNITQEGIKEVSLFFNAARFRNDGIDRDVVTWWNNNLADALDFQPKYDRALILQNGKTSLPKLLIWDERTGRNNSEALIYSNIIGYEDYRGVPVRNNKVQNYAMMFNEDLPGNLYDFHKIDDPRVSVQRNKTFEFTASYECNDLSDFDITKNIGLPGGFIGTMEAVTINYSDKTIIIKGKV